jgi:hypothetical protein
MALIAVAADKGAPGVSTASLALAAVWPRPVLLAECDPAGGDLVYRLPSADGGRLDPRRGLLSLAVAARRGIGPRQVWEHTQKLHGGLDVLAGVANAEQAGGLQLLWGKIGQVLAALPDLDVVADCGRLGMDGPFYDMLGHASSAVLISRPNLEGVVRLRDRVTAVAAALAKRGHPGVTLDVVIVADYKQFRQATADVNTALEQGRVPGRVVGGLAYEPKSAEMLRGEWGGKLDKSMLIRTARDLAAQLTAELPALPGAAHPAGQQPRPQYPPAAGQPPAGPPGPRPTHPRPDQRPGPPQPQSGPRAARTHPPQDRPVAGPRREPDAPNAQGPQPDAHQDRLVAGPPVPQDRPAAGPGWERNPRPPGPPQSHHGSPPERGRPADPAPGRAEPANGRAEPADEQDGRERWGKGVTSSGP